MKSESSLDGLVAAVADGDIAALDLLLTDDEHVGNAVRAAGVADLVANLLVAIVHLGADAGGNELIADGVGVVAALLGDGQDLDLQRSEPSGNFALRYSRRMPMKRSMEPKQTRWSMMGRFFSPSASM